jgi:hypothetical protein
MAKASITPTSVSYYEKIKGTYFEGDFSALSQWLGTEDYNKIQNMLLGEPLDDLSKGYKESLGEQSYRLDDLANDNTKRHSILARQILVFKTRNYADSGRKDDSG